MGVGLARRGLAKAGAGTTAPSHTQAPEQLAVGLVPLSKARHLSSKKMEQRAWERCQGGLSFWRNPLLSLASGKGSNSPSLSRPDRTNPDPWDRKLLSTFPVGEGPIKETEVPEITQ